MKSNLNIFWFRRDLRLEDNVGLFHALNGEQPVLPIFIFDSNILERLPNTDARVTFIYDTLQLIKSELETHYHSSIALYFGNPLDVFKDLVQKFTIDTVYTNVDYEPYGQQRDSEIDAFLKANKTDFKPFKDHVIFEKNDIVKSDGTPYLVYTPYMKTWKAKFHGERAMQYDTKAYFKNLVKDITFPNLALSEIGFKPSHQKITKYSVSDKLIQNYEDTRNFPALEGTSRLGPHLRFGTVSIRQMINKAVTTTNEIFWQELIWREFFMQILWHFPHTMHTCFKPKYERIEWRNNEIEFKFWCEGKTGYPLVDAGMRELNQTGFMHNRTRMVVGSFLCKHLLIDWRWGEAYFAEKLHDYELASNVGNWQWVAGCGVDAAPYFRIFNPTTQMTKFDKHFEYVKKWVPEWQDETYANPIVDHKEARERCLNTYKSALL